MVGRAHDILVLVEQLVQNVVVERAGLPALRR
jgi:hypothetical protein